MLNIDDFFAACTGLWVSERTYHYGVGGEIERSHTEFQVDAIPDEQKRRVVTLSFPEGAIAPAQAGQCPGFSIAFDTVSEKGVKVGMKLMALFVPENYLVGVNMPDPLPAPVAAQVTDDGEILRGYYRWTLHLSAEPPCLGDDNCVCAIGSRRPDAVDRSPDKTADDCHLRAASGGSGTEYY
jgi:CpeS-like protein